MDNNKLPCASWFILGALVLFAGISGIVFDITTLGLVAVLIGALFIFVNGYTNYRTKRDFKNITYTGEVVALCRLTDDGKIIYMDFEFEES